MFQTIMKVLANGEADGDVLQQLSHVGQMVGSRDFNGALSIHRKLTQTSWDTHKEWLKPLKSGLEIAKKNAGRL